MKTYIDENGKSVLANNYQEAAEKLYGQARSHKNKCKTTWAHRRRDADGNGWAEVNVWRPGDKIGNFYGIQQDAPIRHILMKMNKLLKKLIDENPNLDPWGFVEVQNWSNSLSDSQVSAIWQWAKHNNVQRRTDGDNAWWLSVEVC